MLPRCRLNLDDAVTVIRNLSFSPSKTHESLSKNEIESLVGKRVQKALLSFSKRQSSQLQHVRDLLGENESSYGGKDKTKSPKNKAKRKKRYKSSEQGMFCSKYGGKDQMTGHDDCTLPSFLTKKRKAERSQSCSAKEGPFGNS